MAAVWLEADVPALVRLATLNELLEEGEATAMALAEIRQLEDRFGLSPMARLRLVDYPCRSLRPSSACRSFAAASRSSFAASKARRAK
jgi:hypothetical protein